jgi:hypothetical protein
MMLCLGAKLKVWPLYEFDFLAKTYYSLIIPDTSMEYVYNQVVIEALDSYLAFGLTAMRRTKDGQQLG